MAAIREFRQNHQSCGKETPWMELEVITTIKSI